MMKVFKYQRKYLSDRDTKILELCNKKKVLHIGACDSPFTIERQNNGNLLYSKIDKVASEQLGIDIDPVSIEYLNKIYGEGKVLFFDMNKLENLNFKPDIIIFGEVIEHLMNIEIALTNLKKVMGPETTLLISTPNAFHIRNFARIVLGGFEILHSDHKVLFSMGYLLNLLDFNELHVQNYYFTYIGAKGFLGKVDKFLGRIFPGFTNTIMVLAKLK